MTAASAAAVGSRQPGKTAGPDMPAVPAVPASAQFVGRPAIAPAGSGLKQVCSTPTRPGQMACMALIKPTARHAGPDASSPSGYTPQQLQDAYGLTSAASDSANGETIAVVDAYNDPNAAGDLAAYRSKFGLPACATTTGCLQILNQYGGTSLPKADPSGAWELEESLDLDMVSAICPNCSIILIEANSASISDLAVAERTAASGTATVVSNSWGSGAEFIGENKYDADFYAPGVAIVTAGGDDGYGTQYPAVNPYVTSVGATSLVDSGGSWSQSAWGGVGSGCSSLEPKPSWQDRDNSSPRGCLNRTINDVSADGDPSTGVAIYDTVKDSDLGGAPDWTEVGGTSVSTPIIAGTYALADIVAGGPGKGLISWTFPAAYPYAAGSGLTSVSGGSNGKCESDRQYLCHATGSFSGPTGLGTPSGTNAFTFQSADQVTIIDPGTQVVQAGGQLSLLLDYQPGEQSPTFTTEPASLPGSLFVDGGGILSGTAPSSPGVYKITVTNTVSGFGSGSTTFSLVVLPKLKAAHPGAGEVKLSGGGHCLAGAGGAARIEACAGQQWTFRPGGADSGAGTLRSGGKCLEIKSGNGNGAKATLQSCGSSSRQQWTYSGGKLHNVAIGLCLAIHGSTSAGRQAVGWSCSSAGTNWVLPAAPVLSGVGGRCLADPSDSAAAGTRISVASCSASAGQRWTAQANGTLTIRGECLTVSGSSMLDGAAIVLERCAGNGAQKWLRGPNGELMNSNSGRCLAGPNTARGSALVQDDCYSLPGEIWVIS
ncbi:MAG TPA: ricin-type beta-trefoil lectin domain protein [Streptosporangiaceae bacterium]|nr:ricin-type beta-trefoil lectin domain protein [Streptosporangiaceae bacterium]